MRSMWGIELRGRPMKRKSETPRGWDDKRVQEVIDHYENQTDEERLAKIEAARKAKNDNRRTHGNDAKGNETSANRTAR
jgi:hypothetical protein